MPRETAHDDSGRPRSGSSVPASTRSTDPVQRALDLPDGAHFYRCALQVNPFEYVQRYHKPTSFTDEGAYNGAIVKACQANHIDVIAITDHYQARTAERLREAATQAGIHVLPGFEAVTKDGVHILCLLPPDRDRTAVERVIGDCGVHGQGTTSPTGKYDAGELFSESRGWDAICIAAHVASQGGLLTVLSGQSRINAWRSPYLFACSLPGPVSAAPDCLRSILQNHNPEYRRDRPVAVLNAQDVSSPEELAAPGASCWIKMSEVSIEGLRQAFLDPVSRIRLASDPWPEEHAEFLAVAWQGGFLNGAAVHFNGNLNVLIGGRGAGKSTVIESLRYVLGLEPLGLEASKAHEGIIRQVLRSGTKVSLLVRAHRPRQHEYLIERTVPNPPVVRDESNAVLSVTPADILPRAEVYGQHEISELSKSREKLTRLLERFVDRDPSLARRKSDLKRELERARARMSEADLERQQVEERLASLPALEERLKRYQEARLEERLKEQSLIVREEQVLKSVPDRITPFRELLDRVRRALPIDRAFLSSKALADLPGKDILAGADAVLAQLSRDLETLAGQGAAALDRADQGVAVVRDQWAERKNAVQAAYEHILRELQKSRVDGEEFIRLRRQIEELRPLRERRAALQRDAAEHEASRRNLLAEWEDTKAQEFRQLETAARSVSRKLAERVRVQVSFAGNAEPLFELLREGVGGRLSEAIDALRSRPNLSLVEFAAACRAGGNVLAQKFGLPPAQAERIAAASTDVFMRIEELDLAPTTKIELNVAGEGQSPTWQALDDLSTGQKATAVLLLLLLDSDAPLVVDQPEDDLDNRFITDGVVPKMREEKRRRQFVFSTHNANIPVLGDAELILGLTALGEAGQGQAKIDPEHMGSIDARPVRELVEEVLEGGKDAFEMRRLKYGF
jgi:hypothetical protein